MIFISAGLISQPDLTLNVAGKLPSTTRLFTVYTSIDLKHYSHISGWVFVTCSYSLHYDQLTEYSSNHGLCVWIKRIRTWYWQCVCRDDCSRTVAEPNRTFGRYSLPDCSRVVTCSDVCCYVVCQRQTLSILYSANAEGDRHLMQSLARRGGGYCEVLEGNERSKWKTRVSALMERWDCYFN